MSKAKSQALEHAWKYFQIHAQQRLTMFNFFVAFSAIALASIGAAIQAGKMLAMFGIVMGLIVPIVSFVFWQLDRRTAFLVKHGEKIAIHLEQELFESKARVFCLEPDSFNERRKGSKIGWKRMRSYRESFQILYVIVALIGLVGAVVSAWVVVQEHRTLNQTLTQDVLDLSQVEEMKKSTGQRDKQKHD